MAWSSYSLDKTAPDGGANPRVEGTVAVAYYTLSNDDGRTQAIRVPFDASDGAEPDRFLAQRCASLDADEQKAAAAKIALDGRTFTPGPQPFFDLSKQQAVLEAEKELRLKVGAALSGASIFSKQQIADAIAVDPTISDKVDALTAAKDALAAAAV